MKRVGLIIPHTDTTLEPDLQRSLQGQCGIHSERAWMDSVSIEDEERMLRDEVPRATEYLKAIMPDLVVFGCTSAGAIRGATGEEEFCNWLEEVMECPVVSAFGSVCRTLRAGDWNSRVHVISPYVPEVHQILLNSLTEAKLNLQNRGCMGYEDDLTIGRIEPSEIVRFVSNLANEYEPEDRLFISCTNLRAVECAATISGHIGCRVTSSNLAIIQEVKKLLEY